METNNKTEQQNNQEATHSGWQEFYNLFTKYRDEALKLGQVVLGTNQESSVSYLRQYVSALYSMAQQIFSFYDDAKEKEITTEWLKLLKEVNDVIYFTSDKDFKNQMNMEGTEFIDEKLKLKLIMFFNKINRMASESGLLVGQENKNLNEPKKGLIGF